MYKAVGFDYGGVFEGVSSTVFNERICKVLDVTHDDYSRSYSKYRTEKNTEKITEEEFWQLFLKDLDREDYADTLAKFLIEMDGATGISSEMISLVDRIRSTGCKVGLLTNRSTKSGKRLRESGLEKHFDAFHISSETGLAKPNADAFQKFAAELSVHMVELIFIDDSVTMVRGAASAGCTSFLFIDPKQCEQELNDLGVL